MSTIVLLVVLAGVVLWVAGAYNGLVSLKNEIGRASCRERVSLTV